MEYVLIIAEKPDASLKIAEALADKKPKRKIINKVPYYELTHEGKKILVGCAVGHLFNLKSADTGWVYPTFNLEWTPSYKMHKASAFTKQYISTLQELCKKASDIVIACDFDTEGSLIGWNVIKYICKRKDGKRMKFSTLTKKELVDSYENASNHLDFPQIKAGETRHTLDALFGFNLSRALTLAVKTTGKFKILSSGRVQGPALKIITEREKEILAFKPEPFWEIELEGSANGKPLLAEHEAGKFTEKDKAESILKKTKGKKAKVAEVKKIEFLQEPPFPFDLTTLQIEAYKVFGISPKETLLIAQDLYTQGLISYPRTSSQKLPAAIQYIDVIKELQKQKDYANLCKEILKGKLKPNEGPKSDPAHPAIYATGEIPKKSTERQQKIYDLVVKRFLATFSTPAKRQTMTIVTDVNKEKFISRGTLTLEPGWHTIYEPYVKLKEEELPDVKEGDEIKVKKISLLEKETQPPKRYTEASIIRILEKKNLGTKATRAAIIDALYSRQYINEKAIEATKLGLAAVETLTKYCPEILDEALTRKFEEEMDQIIEGKQKEEQIIKGAKEFLTKVLEKFKKNEKKIGEGLAEAALVTREELSTVAPCKVCNKGNLVLRRGKFGLFIACNQYPECKTTHSVPANALIKPVEGECPHCKSPVVLVIRKGKRPFKYCISKVCPARLAWIEEQKKKAAAKIEIKQE